jgi:hypothetical protein
MIQNEICCWDDTIDLRLNTSGRCIKMKWNRCPACSDQKEVVCEIIELPSWATTETAQFSSGPERHALGKDSGNSLSRPQNGATWTTQQMLAGPSKFVWKKLQRKSNWVPTKTSALLRSNEASRSPVEQIQWPMWRRTLTDYLAHEPEFHVIRSRHICQSPGPLAWSTLSGHQDRRYKGFPSTGAKQRVFLLDQHCKVRQKFQLERPSERLVRWSRIPMPVASIYRERQDGSGETLRLGTFFHYPFLEFVSCCLLVDIPFLWSPMIKPNDWSLTRDGHYHGNGGCPPSRSATHTRTRTLSPHT